MLWCMLLYGIVGGCNTDLLKWTWNKGDGCKLKTSRSNFLSYSNALCTMSCYVSCNVIGLFTCFVFMFKGNESLYPFANSNCVCKCYECNLYNRMHIALIDHHNEHICEAKVNTTNMNDKWPWMTWINMVDYKLNLCQSKSGLLTKESKVDQKST